MCYALAFETRVMMRSGVDVTNKYGSAVNTGGSMESKQHFKSEKEKQRI